MGFLGVVLTLLLLPLLTGMIANALMVDSCSEEIGCLTAIIFPLPSHKR